LNAWANWSVYNPAFLDGLQARFDGKEMPPENYDASKDESKLPPPETDVAMSDAAQANEAAEKKEESARIVRPKGDWSETQEVAGSTAPGDGDEDVIDEDVDGEALEDDDLDGEALSDDDLDGDALDDNDL
jgi:U2-associated protein SR140